MHNQQFLKKREIKIRLDGSMKIKRNSNCFHSLRPCKSNLPKRIFCCVFTSTPVRVFRAEHQYVPESVSLTD